MECSIHTSYTDNLHCFYCIIFCSKETCKTLAKYVYCREYQCTIISFSVREFGNDCLLYSLDELLRYGDVLNLIRTDETDRVVERKEVSLFDKKHFVRLS